MSQQRENHGFLQGRPYYQAKTSDGLSLGKKYFYNLGDARGRQAAKLKSQQGKAAAFPTSFVAGSGAKFKIVPYVGEFDGRGGKYMDFPTWGMIPYKKMHGGASWRFNTQTPDKMIELQAKYAGKAHPGFIDQFADILADRPRMNGWRGSIPSSEWHPEEHAAYLRDGRPKSKADIARIMGTVGNERQY